MVKNTNNFIDDTFLNISSNENLQVEENKKSNKIFPIKNANFALAILCVCAFFQNMLVGGANNAILTTIERAFYMKSIESALFLSCYDIGNILTSPFISYLGDRTFKPKVIGFSMIGLSVGSTLMTIPKFINYDYSDIFNSYANNSNSNELTCNTFSNLTMVNQSIAAKSDYNAPDSSSINEMKYIFYIANTINGISSVALYTIVISYIENIFEKDKVHMRQGIYYAIGAIGVGCGMIITGLFLNINGVKTSKSTILKNNTNVNWIGAWYLIYGIGAIFNILLSFLVFQFSPSLTLKKETERNNSSLNERSNNKTFKEYLKKFLSDAKLILSNRVFLFIVICTTCETFLIKGFSSYLTKYLEYEYRLPASTSTILTGAIGFISMIGGALLGSYLIGKYKWSIKECSRFVTIILFITSFLFLGIMIHCPQEKFVNSDNLIFKQSNCECDSNKFDPVCFQNEYLFQTACFAGCTHVNSTTHEYSNCLVLNNLIQTNTTIQQSIRNCNRPAEQCKTFLVLVGFIGLAILFLSAIIILPLLRIILESVDLENQSFALGIRSFITKLFGNIPGPIVFASLIDKACVLWTRSPFTPNKTCRLYDNMKFSNSLSILGVCMRFLSFSFAFIAMCFVSRMDSVDLVHDNFSGNSNKKNDDNPNQGEINLTFKLEPLSNDEL